MVINWRYSHRTVRLISDVKSPIVDAYDAVHL